MLEAGDSFGDYKVVRLLGQGGMGSVFLLENAEGIEVAAKILDPATAGDHESRRRFLREAELALGVKHPNLVGTYDVGEDPDTGLCYILMEYVSGGSLADYLKENGALPVEDAVAVVQAMASVLELAREKGIVHRDIKPANIMFAADGTPKLADLGIARGGLAGTEMTTVTQTGMMIGTPAYMAPEQMLDAHKVDTRADIYSLGVVFFEMLTGERPNKDDTVVQLMARAVKGEPLPDVRTLRPEVSASLAQLLNMMVAPDKNGRISTPGQITSALDIIERGGTFAAKPMVRASFPDGRARTPAAPQTSRDRKPIPWKTLIPVGLIAALAVAFAVLAPTREKVVQSVVTTNVVERLVEKTNVVRTVAHTEDEARVETAVRTKDGVYRWKGPEGEWTYRVRDGLASIGDGRGCALYPRPKGRLTIPAAICDVPVAGIAYGAFQDCRDLTSVEISEGISEIDRDVFKDCTSLAKVVLPVSMKKFGSWNFFGTPMRSLDLGRIDYWDGRIIGGMTNLVELKFDSLNDNFVCEDGMVRSRDETRLLFAPRSRATVRFPAGVTTLDAWALCGEDVIVPRQITRVEPMAFGNCHVLRHIRFESPDVSIGYHAFHYAVNLRQVDFPEGLREINASKVFSNCSSLPTIRFPASVRRLGAELFANCSSLRTVAFDGNAPELVDDGRQFRGVDIFRGTPRDLVVLVKRGSKGWNPNGEGLPRCWPVDAGNNARRILYADGEETAVTPDVPLPVRESRSIDAGKLKDPDPTRAVQKALDVLFPGWKTSEAGGGQELGYRSNYCGVDDVLRSHPPCRGVPVTFSKTVAVAGKHPVLHVRLSNHAEGRQFRLCVRVGGRTVRERDIANGWTDVYVDLGKWRGKKAKIDLDHLPTGWCQEWAYWSEIEIVDDATLVEVAAVQGAETPVKILDRKQVVGTNPKKAAQRTCDALFPGWKISECGHLDEAGYEEEHAGRYNLLFTHPPREDVPVVLSRRMNLPRKAPKLYVSVIGGEDFELQVKVNGKIVQRPDVNGREWTDLTVDLSEWAGRNVLIELLNMPTGWQHEEAHWQRLEIR